MKKWRLVSILMGIIGVIVFSISLYQKLSLDNDNLAFSMPFGFGLLVCSIINFIVMFKNKGTAYKTMQTQNDERIITHGISALAMGFIIMVTVIVTIMIMYQFGVKLNVLDSAAIILLSGFVSSLIYFIYKIFRH